MCLPFNLVQVGFPLPTGKNDLSNPQSLPPRMYFRSCCGLGSLVTHTKKRIFLFFIFIFYHFSALTMGQACY